MKRTNLMKAVVCAVMITLVMTSTVFAGTVSDVIKVRGVYNYTENYQGSVGHYTFAGDREYARTTIVNTSKSEKWFQCFVHRYNQVTETYDSWDIESKAVANGAPLSVQIERDKDSKFYDYEHKAKGYSTSMYIAGTLVDEYLLEAWQYYR